MYNLENYKFGNVLRNIRKSKGMTIEELAEKIGKSVPTVYKYETNLVIVDLPTVLEICNALEVDFDSFVDREKIENNMSLITNPFETDLMYLYYIGFDDLTLFRLEIQEENGYQKVYFKHKDTDTIYFIGTLEASHDIAYINMQNYVVTNKKFEKVQIVINLKYSSDNKYMGSITGTNDNTNLPLLKKCLLSKKLATTKSEINEIYDRLKFTDEEKAEIENNNAVTIHFDNKTDYGIMGVNKSK